MARTRGKRLLLDKYCVLEWVGCSFVGTVYYSRCRFVCRDVYTSILTVRYYHNGAKKHQSDSTVNRRLSPTYLTTRWILLLRTKCLRCFWIIIEPLLQLITIIATSLSAKQWISYADEEEAEEGRLRLTTDKLSRKKVPIEELAIGPDHFLCRRGASGTDVLLFNCY